MPRALLPVLVLPTLAVLCLPTSGRAGEAALDLVIEGVRNGEGVLQIALFADESSYRESAEPVARVSVEATEGTVHHRIEGLSPGTYAVAVFHDENRSESLDTTRIGIPVEGYGFSNGARGRTGKPGFQQVAVEVTVEPVREERIELAYLWSR